MRSALAVMTGRAEQSRQRCLVVPPEHFCSFAHVGGTVCRSETDGLDGKQRRASSPRHDGRGTEAFVQGAATAARNRAEPHQISLCDPVHRVRKGCTRVVLWSTTGPATPIRGVPRQKTNIQVSGPPFRSRTFVRAGIGRVSAVRRAATRLRRSETSRLAGIIRPADTRLRRRPPVDLPHGHHAPVLFATWLSLPAHHVRSRPARPRRYRLGRRGADPEDDGRARRAASSREGSRSSPTTRRGRPRSMSASCGPSACAPPRARSCPSAPRSSTCSPSDRRRRARS